MTLRLLRGHKVLGAIAVFVVAFFCLIGALIFFSEPVIRYLTEHKGSEKIGRRLVIEGGLDIDWHWDVTRVHVEGIRLGNAENYKEPDMLTVERFDFGLKPLPLLIGRLEFTDISIIKPEVLLERRTPDDANWNFPALSGGKVAGEAVLADDRHEFPIFDRLEIRDGKVIYRDAVKAMVLDLSLNTVTGRDDSGLEVRGKGEIQQQPFELQVDGGSLIALRENREPYPLKVDLQMGSTKVLVDGKFDDPIKLAGIDSSLEVSGHNLADLFYLTAIPLPLTPPYRFAGQLRKEGGVWSYNDFDGVVGASDMAGSLTYDTSKERGFLQADLRSKVLASEDLGGFIGLAPSGEHAAPEQRGLAEAQKSDARLIPDVPLELERLRVTDLDVAWSVDRIAAPELPLKGMKVRFRLDRGLLRLDPLDVTLEDGRADGVIQVDARGDVPDVDLDLNLRNLSLVQFFRGTSFEQSTSGRFGGRIDLGGSGLSLADVLADSDGKLAVMMSGGKISLLLVEASDLDLAQALPLFIGRDKPTPVRCGVADFHVVDGHLASEVVVLDTEDSRLVGDVEIDLARETIDARLDAKPKDGSIFSVKTPITVSGKLKSPAVGLEEKKTLTQGASAVALGALVTPFAALLPFVQVGHEKNVDCQALIAAAKE